MKIWQKGLLFITSFLATLALNSDLSTSITLYITNGVQESGRNVVSIILFILLYKFFDNTWKSTISNQLTIRKFICSFLPAMFFATFMVLGYSFAQQNNWELVLTNSNKAQLFTAILFWLGYLGLFFFLIIRLFAFVECFSLTNTGEKSSCGILQKYLNILSQNPFRTAFLTLFLLYIPYIILSYPAIFMSDTYTQILQGYNLPEGVPPYMNLIHPDIKWNNHHPVFHTLLIHVCIKLGTAVFSSYNIGIFIFALLQAVCLWTVVSLCVTTLIQKQISVKISMAVLFYFVISPWVQNYTFLITKDVPYAIFLLWFTVTLFRIATETFTKMLGLWLAFSSLGLIVFRNDGKYLVLITLLLCLFLFKKSRKTVACFVIGIFTFSILLNNVLYPMLQITPGSKRELLSIPFQQTARYIRDIGDGVTLEEKAAISAVLDYDHIMHYYDPEVSDTVKETFHEDATTAQLITYFKVWLQMLLKHPGSYIQATMNNVYSYFYPEFYAWPTGSPHYDSYEWSEMVMDITNTANENLKSNFYYPAGLDKARNQYEVIRETIVSYPIFSIIVTPAFYTWMLILWLFYCIMKKNMSGLVCTIPLLLVTLICIASPVNGWYTRYLFPAAFCMPASLLFGILLTNHNSKNHEFISS